MSLQINWIGPSFLMLYNFLTTTTKRGYKQKPFWNHHRITTVDTSIPCHQLWRKVSWHKQIELAYVTRHRAAKRMMIRKWSMWSSMNEILHLWNTQPNNSWHLERGTQGNVSLQIWRIFQSDQTHVKGFLQVSSPIQTKDSLDLSCKHVLGDQSWKPIREIQIKTLNKSKENKNHRRH